MLKLKIKKTDPAARLPNKMTASSAGYDLYSNNKQDIVITTGEVKLIGTGIAIGLPPGYEAQIRPRSGLAIKHQIGILNSPGTIDADYRGEIKVILFNFGKTDFIVKPNTRIAQMVVAKHEELEFEVSKELDDTSRGEGGFGHTELN